MGESAALTVHLLMWLRGGDYKRGVEEKKDEEQRGGKLSRAGDRCKETY